MRAVSIEYAETPLFTQEMELLADPYCTGNEAASRLRRPGHDATFLQDQLCFF